MMHAEIISIGDEITSGQILDTNSQWLSLRLEELGVKVLYHTTVGDESDAMVPVFQHAYGRSDVIVTTGGLGATPADMTREALARSVGRKLVMDPKAMEHIRQLFARRKREMPKRNEVQAMFPEGSRMVPNPNGTAPGIDLEVPRQGKPPVRLFALPGVPAEMKEMFAQTVARELRKAGAGQRVIRHRRIHCFGAGETQIVAMLPDIVHRSQDPHVGITASQATITLRLSASGATEEACQAAMEPIAATIRQHLGKLVFGEDDDELQDAVIRLLRQKGKTLATAEWGTAGLVADWLGNVADAPGFYLGGVVVQSDAVAKRMLDVPADPNRAGAGGLQGLVANMASACRHRFDADYGLAVGPFPKFDAAASDPKPVFFALAAAAGVSTKSMPFSAHPALLKALCGKNALDMLRLVLME